jgi:putative ABC transport system ATP-binding protein
VEKKRMEGKFDTYEKIDSEEIIIQCADLYRDYEIGDFIVRAVDNVSLNVKKEEFLAIAGPSGAGKTTLLNLLGGLDSPTRGKIRSFGVLMSDLSEESLATFRLMYCGFIFQNYNLISTLSVAENIMFPMSLAGVSLTDQRRRAAELIELVQLSERKEHLPFQLSAGEQQRVAISRALANNPPVVIADEPTANLDTKTAKMITNIFTELKKEEEKSIICATHDKNLLNLADRVIYFEDGKIKEASLE